MRHALALTIAILPAALGAHPHVFVDSSVQLDINADAQVTDVTVTWTYDDFTTLLILEDLGIDPDGDGILTAAETEQMLGFDLIQWPDGFEGDLYLYRDGAKVPLAHPTPVSVTLTDGRLTGTHQRVVPDVPADGLVLRQYDPTYFVAYTLGSVTLPAPCRADITPPDPAKAEAALKDAIENTPEDHFEVLELGIYHADEVVISCNGSS